MSYNLKSIEKLIKGIEERSQKRKQKNYNKKIGYAPKCKVCNSEYLDDIEQLREDGLTYREILEELEITNISSMSLSRHFKNHYPNSQAYKEKQHLEMLENTREAYLKFPFLEEFFKDRDLKYLESFNTGFGFCTDRFGLCEFVQAGTVSNCNDTVTNLRVQADDEIEEKGEYSYFGLDRDKQNEIKLKYTDRITDCLSCKDRINEKRINLLERIITYNFLNIAPENKELYYNLLQFDGNTDEFIRTLEEGTDNQQG